MKLLLVLVGVWCVAQGASVPGAVGKVETFSLQSDLRDILDLIDTDAIAKLLADSLEDPDMQNLFTYIFSPEFRQLYMDVASQPEVSNLMAWLDSQGVNVRGIFAVVRDYLELPPVEWRQNKVVVASLAQRNHGVVVFWEQLMDILPLAEMHQEAMHKYETSAEFREFVDKLRSEQARELFGQLQGNEVYQHMIGTLGQLGLDIEAIRKTIGQVLGWL